MMTWSEVLAIRAYSARGLVLIVAVGRTDPARPNSTRPNSTQWTAYIDNADATQIPDLCIKEVVSRGSNLDKTTAVAIFGKLDPSKYVKVQAADHVDEDF